MYTFKKTSQFEDWFSNLRDRTAKMRILARLKVVERGSFGVWRSLGEKVSELKIEYGPGYRIYYTIKNDTVILLLIGGDKSTQSRDIEKAKEILKNLEEQHE